MSQANSLAKIEADFTTTLVAGSIKSGMKAVEAGGSSSFRVEFDSENPS